MTSELMLFSNKSAASKPEKLPSAFQGFWQIKGAFSILVSYLDPEQCLEVSSFYFPKEAIRIWGRAMDTHTYADHKATSAILKIHKRYGGEEMSLFSVIKNYLPALREYDFATAHPESGMMAIALASDPEGARVLLRSRRFLGALDVRTIRIVITHFVKNIFFSPKTSPSQRAHYLQHFKQALYTSCIANATSRDKLNGLLELAENGDPQIRVSDNGLLARIKEAGRSRRKALEVLEPRPSISFIDALADFFANSTSMGNFSSSVEVMF